MEKVMLVTGAASGIGAATATLAASEGYVVYATMRDPNGRNKGAASELSRSCRVIETDVCSESSVRDAFDLVIAECGRIDVVVNSAGWAIRGAIEELHIDQLKREFDVNFFGAIRVSQAAASQMRKQGAGHIVQISSISGLTVSPLFGAYQSSKWALEAASEAMAVELGHFGVKVLLTEPGNVDTNVVVEEPEGLVDGTSVYTELAEQLAASRPIDTQLLSAEEVAHSVMAAISDPETPLRTLVGDAEYVLRRQELGSAEYWNWFRTTRRLVW